MKLFLFLCLWFTLPAMANDYPHLSNAAQDVLFNDGTERAFTSDLLEEKREGHFVCAACGTPLFKSETKFESGTGWPSFWQPIDGAVGTKEDNKLFSKRTEYHCNNCNGHQGHVFEDGPNPTGLRYCNNGVALRFEPADTTDAVATESVIKTAYLAGGCFWCIEKDMEALAGVIEATSGYAGGHVENPSYKQVTTGATGHREALKVTYDNSITSYRQIIEQFITHIDPFDKDGQFCDRGFQYSPAIYVQSDAEKQTAQDIINQLVKKYDHAQDIGVALDDYSNFFDAEDYHQNYAKKNPLRYTYYRKSCGRDKRIKQLWE